MKWLFLLLPIFLLANDMENMEKFMTSKQCFNVVDVLSPCSITTKETGEFSLKLIRKCPYNVGAYIVNDKNETISQGKVFGKFVIFNNKSIVRNARIMFIYRDFSGNEHIELSTDNFAIRPSKIEIDLPEKLIQGHTYIVKANVVGFDGNDVNYTNRSFSYKIDGAFSLNITNGKGFGHFKFNPGKQTMKIYDEHFADIDKDDTPYEKRVFGFSKNIDVSTGSKSWFGIGTNESENSPDKNTVRLNTKITNKHLDFNRIQW